MVLLFLVAMNGIVPDDPEKFLPELGTKSTTIKYLFAAVTLLNRDHPSCFLISPSAVPMYLSKGEFSSVSKQAPTD